MKKIFVALALCAACANGQGTDSSAASAPASRLFDKGAVDLGQPTTITSERFEFDYKQMVAIFDEQVKVAHPQFYLEADQVFVFIGETNEVKNILAQGNIVMTNDNRRASCDWALYTRAEGTLVMRANEGNVAQLMRGADSVAGEQITLWLDDERMVVEKSTFVIAPGTLKQGDTKKETPEAKPAKPVKQDKPAEGGPSLYTDPEAKTE